MEKDYIGPTLKQILNNKDHTYAEDDSFFIRSFDIGKRVAIENNYQASLLARGYDPKIHTNLLNSKIVKSIHKKLMQKITSNVDLEGEKDSDVDYIKNKLINFKDALSEAISYMLSRGEAVITIDEVGEELEEHMIGFKSYPSPRFNILENQYGEIIECNLFKMLIDGENSYCKYSIVEHRFKKNDKYYLEYNVIKYSYQNTKSDKIDRQDKLEEKDLPANIIKILDGIKINKRKELKCIGVYYLKNSSVNELCPNSKVGESQYLDVYADAVSFDESFTFRNIDKNIGRGRCLVPSINKPTTRLYSVDSGKEYRSGTVLDNTFIQNYENLGMGNTNPQSIQFNLRTQEWLADKNDLVAEICTKCGLSIFDYNPTLAGGVRTAREVDELGDITAQTVSSKRAIVDSSFKKALKDICTILGLQNVSLFIKWNKSTTLNVAANNELVLQRYNSGLCSKLTALKELHPDWDQSEIDAELERISKEKDLLNADTVFGNM